MSDYHLLFCSEITISLADIKQIWVIITYKWSSPVYRWSRKMILTLFIGDYNLLLYVVFKIYLLTILNASASASPPLNLQKGQMSVSRRSRPRPCTRPGCRATSGLADVTPTRLRPQRWGVPDPPRSPVPARSASLCSKRQEKKTGTGRKGSRRKGNANHCCLPPPITSCVDW